MNSTPRPHLTQSDTIVLDSLLQDAALSKSDINNSPIVICDACSDQKASEQLSNLNDPTNKAFHPTVVTGWDSFPATLDRLIVKPYTTWASTIVRRPTDVVFLTHILLYLSTSVPSALFLYHHFTWPHALLHWLMQAWYCGPFTLMLHNHIHNNGVLARKYASFDRIWPYILQPLMGHTWDSYYYHHVKHHHVENNGPGDLSSTIRYQRDDAFHFLCYVSRFIALVWIELPLYFLRKGKRELAVKTAVSELSSYGAIYLACTYNLRASVFVFVIPLIQMRIGMMLGNWGQHALVDQEEPDSDFRSSITLIDVSSNRHCFNDGYHTSHHLNPRRHWRDHPLALMKAKSQYQEGRALIFQDIDYIMMTISLLRKNYIHLASCLVPIGDQVGMDQKAIADMLRSKTRRFSEDEILKKFGKLG